MTPSTIGNGNPTIQQLLSSTPRDTPLAAKSASLTNLAPEKAKDTPLAAKSNSLTKSASLPNLAPAKAKDTPLAVKSNSLPNIAPEKAEKNAFSLVGSQVSQYSPSLNTPSSTPSLPKEKELRHQNSTITSFASLPASQSEDKQSPEIAHLTSPTERLDWNNTMGVIPKVVTTENLIVGLLNELANLDDQNLSNVSEETSRNLAEMIYDILDDEKIDENLKMMLEQYVSTLFSNENGNSQEFCKNLHEFMRSQGIDITLSSKRTNLSDAEKTQATLNEPIAAIEEIITIYFDNPIDDSSRSRKEHLLKLNEPIDMLSRPTQGNTLQNKKSNLLKIKNNLDNIIRTNPEDWIAQLFTIAQEINKLNNETQAEETPSSSSMQEASHSSTQAPSAYKDQITSLLNAISNQNMSTLKSLPKKQIDTMTNSCRLLEAEHESSTMSESSRMLLNNLVQLRKIINNDDNSDEQLVNTLIRNLTEQLKSLAS